MKTTTLIVALGLLCTSSLYAQHGHTHAHQQNEIGLSVGAAYEIEHKEWKPVVHGHFFRAFTPDSRWAWGAGLEYLPGDETHMEIGAGVRFAPIDQLQLSLMPGVSITDNARFSIHTELAYEAINLGNFHLGPVVGYAWTKDHSHLSAGIHAAFAFGGKHKKQTKR